MDPATVITLCKENIQPLRHGRNATQLGTALRAQEDAETQQMLMQEKQMYEDAIKNYQGDDPLENWYEYILWVEQSYPKSGHESHIGKLLQQCLATFEKETKYHQDRRYIRLWINYISIQKNPLELYQLLYNTGIGTMVADMYRAWAFELEQVNDCKRADEVYMLGITARAEPRDELIYARENFQMAVGRRALGCDQEKNEVALSEQRQAFSSLRAIKSGKRATNIRTGHRVKDYVPGVVPQSTTSSHSFMSAGQVKDGSKSNAKIQIYQDEAARVDLRCASILDHVPIEDTVHKENTIKPGQWSNASRKFPLIPASVRPAFKVHEDHLDEDDHHDNNTNINYDILRLFPNHTSFFDGSKYPEHMAVPVFVPDAPSAIMTKPRYPKDLVYLNNADRSMEEIRAEKYFNKLRNIGNSCSNIDETLLLSGIGQNLNGYTNNNSNINNNNNSKSNHIHHHQQQHHLHHHQQQQQETDAPDENLVQKQFELEHHRRVLEQNHEIELERQRKQAEMEEQMREAVELEKQRREAELERQRREAELERQRREIELERQRREAAEMERQRREAAELERQQREAAELERQQREAAAEIERQRIEAERIESQRMEAELSRQSKLQSSSYNLHHSSSGVVESGVEQMLGQSLTVNTKEAMSVVQDLWNSPTNTNSPLMESPMLHRSVDSRSKLNFDIHIDSSMTQQHAMSLPRHHSNYNNIQNYHDQENHQPYNSPYNPIQAHHQSYQIPDSYHYPIQQQHQQQQQSIQHLHSPQIQPHIQHNMMQQHQQQHHHHHSQLHHQSPLHPPHLQSPHLSHHSQSPNIHTPTHQLQQQHHHPHHPSVSPHIAPPPTHHAYNTMHSNPNVNFHHHNHQHHHHHQQQQQQQHQQQYPQSSMMHHPPMQSESQKQLDFVPYMDPQSDTNKDYRRSELPYIKSPGMNRRDLKYLESADNKENNTATGYNSVIEDNKQPVENNLFVDESLGISPLAGANDTCYTESFRGPLPSSTPMTNQFRPSTYRTKDIVHFQPPQLHFVPHVQQQQQQQQQQPQLQPQPQPQQQQQQQQQQHSEVPVNDPEDKLSVIMESTREYISSSSSSSANTRTTQFGFTLTTREDHLTIKEQSISQDIESTEALLSANVNTDQNIRTKIQSMNTQSPRTMQRNVDQITSEIKNNCDLRIPFNLDREPSIKIDNSKINNDNNKNISNNISSIITTSTTPINNNTINNSIPNIIDEPMEEAKDDDDDNNDNKNVKACDDNDDYDDEADKFQLPVGDINPFDKTLISGLLKNIKFPQLHHSDGYARLNININKFVPSSKITLGTDTYELEKCLGKGTYGTVLKAYDPLTEKTVALKTQKPAWVWEFYIAREIKTRLKNPHMLRGFMDVTKAYVTNNGSILVSEFSKYGTLLAVTNQVKIATGKPLTEALAIFFTIEMLQIVEYLHKCQIIHGDIKPDNFLLMHLPTEDVRPTIQLIDYGCSIDMSLFPEGTKFTQIIKTEDFTCIEMQTGRPWTYQTDLYCVAASAHCLLFGTYMRAVPTGDRWFINTKMPRYVQKAWETLFHELLNIESCEKMPDLGELRRLMQEALDKIPALEMKLRSLSNVLKGR